MTCQHGRIQIEQDKPQMSNSDQETQDLPAEQGSQLRMALVESTSDVGTVDSEDSTVENTENRQIMWWALALPVLAIMIIIAAHLLNAPATTGAQDEKSWRDDPALPEESDSPKQSRDKSPSGAFVSSIAYNETRPLAFINDQMVPEGAVVDGFTVFKIHQEAVEFEKNGKRWTQKVGE